MKKNILIFVLLLLSSTVWGASGYGGGGLRPHDHSATSQGNRQNQAPLKPRSGDDGAGTLWSAVEAYAGNSTSKWGLDVLNADYAFDTHGVRIRAAAGKIGNLRFANDSGTPRWTIKKTDTAESGSNAGSNLQFLPHSDAGTGQSFYVEINRATGALSSTKPCATGYTRVTPNYCATTGAPQVVVNAMGPSAACTQSLALTNVTDAKGIYARSLAAIVSTNALGLKIGAISLFGPSDTGCTGGVGAGVDSAITRVREEVAVVAGTSLVEAHGKEHILATSTTGRFYYNEPGVMTTGSTVSVIVLGYFD